MSKENGRKVITHSLYARHVEVEQRLARESGLTESQVIRELLELVSNCHAVWNGCFLKFEKPKFLWGENERERYL